MNRKLRWLPAFLAALMAGQTACNVEASYDSASHRQALTYAADGEREEDGENEHEVIGDVSEFETFLLQQPSQGELDHVYFNHCYYLTEISSFYGYPCQVVYVNGAYTEVPPGSAADVYTTTPLAEPVGQPSFANPVLVPALPGGGAPLLFDAYQTTTADVLSRTLTDVVVSSLPMLPPQLPIDPVEANPIAGRELQFVLFAGPKRLREERLDKAALTQHRTKERESILEKERLSKDEVATLAKEVKEWREERHEAELKELKEQNGADRIPRHESAVLGGGISGTATAKPGERVYDKGNFWEGLVNLPTVFQTNLKGMESGGFVDPSRLASETKAGERIPRESVVLSIHEMQRVHDLALLKGEISVEHAKDAEGGYLVKVKDGERVLTERVMDLTIATGMGPHRTTVDVVPPAQREDAQKARDALVADGKLRSGDAVLADAALGTKVKDKEVVILGRSGNAVDVAAAVLKGGASKVTMIGNPPPEQLTATTAYKTFMEANKDRIVEKEAKVEGLKKEGDRAEISGVKTDVIVESLGRKTQVPLEIAALAGGKEITYKPVIVEGRLLRMDVLLEGQTTATLHLVGDAATQIPAGVKISDADRASHQEAVKRDGAEIGKENFLPGFVEGAQMGGRNRDSRLDVK